MGANIAGIYGAQIFRQDDRPRYRRGFGVNIAVLTVGLTLAVVRYIDDRFRRVRKGRQMQDLSGEGSDGNVAVVPSEDQPVPVVLESGKRLSVS
jgi:hypothetical protein